MEKDLTRQLYIEPNHLEIAKSNPWSRVGGSLADGFIELVVLGILISLFFTISNTGTIEDIAKYATTLIVIYQVISLFLNLIVPVLTKGQTLGKMAARTRIISFDGNTGNIIIYLVRQSFFTVIALLAQIEAISTPVSFALFIVYIICFVLLFGDSHGRTLQDRFARTMVVDDKVWQEYRERAFYEIDNPELFIKENEEVNDDYIETSPKEDEESINESINNEEEIL
ncbi:RDD family protein [Candidatus Izimaplasma bacterium HR1]|jgi:uncharacterized RDD family membrane protein YckC|uniref:RDD family protein n=1 Tax=Candidatus Izimoplasma sp. HR1 TaxID=1541959 RepID=UPI0004F84ADF|nr:RDD family protein [Candidatus Izimaplasma bacterium HR1]